MERFCSIEELKDQPLTVTHRDLQRVNRAVEYVKSHLADKISVADIAKQVHLSEFHFHRIFKTVINEPFNKYLQRQRLELALYELRSPKKKSIHQVSVQCGFSSQANFSKAFSAYFGFSPSTYRKGNIQSISKNGKVFSKLGKNQQAPFLYHDAQSVTRTQASIDSENSISTITLPTSYYCYVASTQGYTLEGIAQAWGQLKELLISLDIPLQCEGRSVGFCQDNDFITPRESCRYEAGYRIDDLQQLIDNKISYNTLKAGKYLSCVYQGKLSELKAHYLWLFNEYFSHKKIFIADRTLIERYREVDIEQDFVDLETLISIY